MWHPVLQLDTNILILWAAIEPDALPQEVAISAVTLAELAAGVQSVAGDEAVAVERPRT